MKISCFVFLVILILRILMGQGRANVNNPIGSSKASRSEEACNVVGVIGSRPPRCEGRCRWCGHCEAIQVPTNPQLQAQVVANIRGDDTSNYKPMTWKCKCGNFIFNP